MSFNRTKYDSTAYDKELISSISPGEYRIFNSFPESDDKCFAEYNPSSKGNSDDVKSNNLAVWQLADVESDLSRRNMKLKKDIKNNMNWYALNNKKNCSSEISPEDTRFTHPIDNYRSMSLTEYFMEPYLSVNPQNDITQMVLYGISSRLYSKDAYVMPEQAMWEDGKAFPPPAISKSLKSSDDFCTKKNFSAEDVELIRKHLCNLERC
jgi:hypothetical protein